MSQAPRVHRLVLFKHGVAYVERSGPADGPFTLSFERDEMNDVLKSLAVWVADGTGTVGAVGFEAPEDPEQELATRGLLLQAGGALHQLLHALRGRRIEIGDGTTRRVGEVVGYQNAQGRGESAIGDRLLLRTDRGAIELFELDGVRTLHLVEERSRADLALLVDKSREATAREHRTIRVDVEGTAKDLRCAYIVPAPMWRVSYRLVVREDEVTVMAWAIIHNPADEDLEAVSLTLTTGQPMSFVIDLYQPKHVQRAVLEETSRAASAPQPIARAKAAMMPAAAPAPAPLGGVPPQAPGQAFGLGAAAAAMTAATDTGDRSEYFEYRVREPISVERGGSAMVPLTAAKVSSRRERLWSESRGAHPDVVLRFDNATEVVLEEGPAVIYDDGGYAGEAMVPYSARGAEVRLAFARDLSLRCRDERHYQRELHALRFGDANCIETTEHRQRHRLIAESDHAEPVTVVFEVPRDPSREIAPSSPQPIETTAGTWRFLVEAPAGGAATLEIEERWKTAQRVALSGLAHPQVHRWVEARFLGDALRGALGEVLEAWTRRDAKLAERAAREAQLHQIYMAQENLQKQLAVLKSGGEEGALRTRYAKELAANQDRVGELAETIDGLRRDAEAAEADAQRRLFALTEG